MEILILAMIFSVVVKRGAEDLIHAAKGGTPQRYAAASKRRKSGAAGRYVGQLWDDSWGDLLTRHTEKRDRRNAAPRPVRDPGQWRTVFTQFGDDFGNWARATWRYGWNRHAARRQEKRLRDSAGRQTVPGTVVPNAQDEDGDRPQDRPVPEPRIVPDGDGGTDLHFGEDEDDPTGVSSCPECRGAVLVDGEICPSCRDRQEQRNQHREDQDAFRAAGAIEDGWDETGASRTFGSCPGCGRDMYLGPDGICSDCQHKKNTDPDGVYTPYKELTHRKTWLVEFPDGREFITDDPEMYARLGYKLTGVDGYDHANGFEVTTRYQPYKSAAPGTDPSPATPTTEGPTPMTTIPTGEVTSLSQTIRFCEDSAQAYRAQVHAIEQTQATLSAEEVSGPAADAFAQAMEQSNSAANSMETAAAEFRKHLVVQEAYDSVQGAGTKKFVTAGR